MCFFVHFLAQFLCALVWFFSLTIWNGFKNPVLATPGDLSKFFSYIVKNKCFGVFPIFSPNIRNGTGHKCKVENSEVDQFGGQRLWPGFQKVLSCFCIPFHTHCCVHLQMWEQSSGKSSPALRLQIPRQKSPQTSSFIKQPFFIFS